MLSGLSAGNSSVIGVVRAGGSSVGAALGIEIGVTLSVGEKLGKALGVLVGKGSSVGIALTVGVVVACSGWDTQAASNNILSRNVRLLCGFDFIDEVQVSILYNETGGMLPTNN